MSEIIEVENSVTMDCRRVIHLMSNTPFPDPSPISEYEMGEGGKVEVVQEAGVWHLRAEWPFRGALRIEAEGWPRAKTMVAWSFEGCSSVTEALINAGYLYLQLFGKVPAYGFVKRLPGNIEPGIELPGSLMVFEAEWMLEKAAVVGG